ncbi:MAG: sulfurtransferase-like selenium metabolism protein YedF [Dehalococcoidales bacterium]|nr:sulfurtransferase-like selenium metabolism protein YedF [Dehalococcoidales bacterium]
MPRKTILVQSEVLGRGNDELGMLLMSKFLDLLNDSKTKPASLLFLNTGVKLVAEGSWALAHLKKLEEQGVQILACGTCLDFFGLTDKLKVGRPTDMLATIDSLLNSDVVCL